MAHSYKEQRVRETSNSRYSGQKYDENRKEIVLVEVRGQLLGKSYYHIKAQIVDQSQRKDTKIIYAFVFLIVIS